MHTDYLNPVLRELRDQQVRFAPREKKLEQVNRAERLLAEIEPEHDLHLRVPLLPDHRLPARVVRRNVKLTGEEAEPRPAAVRRGRFGRGRRRRPRRPASRCSRSKS